MVTGKVYAGPQKDTGNTTTPVLPPENVQPKDTTTLPSMPLQETVLNKHVVETGQLKVKDNSIVSDIEFASSESLKRAATKIAQSSPNYTEAEKILLSVASGIFDIMYPLEKRTWDSLVVPKNNVYTAAIESARMGIYDYNTGNSDFLSLTLPSLVLLTTPSLTSFYPESEAALKKALDINPQTLLATYLLGTLYQRQNKTTEALSLFQAAYTLNQNSYPITLALSHTLLKTGQAAQAYTLAVTLFALYPQNMDIIRLCAQAAIEAKLWTDAEQYVSMVLQKESDNAQFLLMRIRILVENAEYLKASSLLDVYSKKEKTSRDYLLLRSRLQKEWNKNTVSATATLQEALRLYPEDQEVLLAAAELAAQTRQKIASFSANDLIMKILEKDPDNEEALMLLINDAIAKKEWKQAYDRSSELIKTNPSKAVQVLHIEAAIGYGHNAEALLQARKLYQENVTDESALLWYIRALIASAETTLSRRLIDTQLAVSTVSNTLKSNLYYERSRIVTGEDPTLADLRSSLTVNPRNQNALFALYQFYYDKKDYRKAQYYLKQVFALNPADPNILRLQTEIDAILAQ